MSRLLLPGHRYDVIKPDLGTPIDWQNPLTRGLVGYWELGQGGLKALSLIPGMADGTPDSAAAFQVERGKYGAHIYRDLDWNAEFVMPDAGTKLQDFTVETIVRPTADSGAFWLNNGDTDHIYWSLSCTTINARLSGTVSDGVTPNYAILYDSTYNGQWIHAVFAHDGGRSFCYLAGNGKFTWPSYSAMNARTGNGINQTLTTRGQDCVYFRLWNRALSASEALELYYAPFGIFEPSSRTRFFWVGATGGATTHELAGVTAGVSTATGTLTVEHTLAGAAAGVSTATGTLEVEHTLAGTCAGVSTATGTLEIVGEVLLAGTCAGVSSATGALTVAHTLVGTSAGVSTATGTLGVVRTLGGAAAANSTGSGDLVLEIALVGQSDGQSGAEGDLIGVWLLAGQSDGQSTATGSMAEWYQPNLIEVWTVPERERSWTVPERERSWTV